MSRRCSTPAGALAHARQDLGDADRLDVVANRGKTIDETVEAGAARGSARQARALRPLALVRAALRRQAAARTCCSTRSTRWRKAPAERRLLPDGQPLDLFVTVTDFRGHPEDAAAQFAARSGRDRASAWSSPSPIMAMPSAHFAASGRARLRRARHLELPRRLPARSPSPSSTSVLAERRHELAGPRRVPRHARCRSNGADNRAEDAVLIDGSVLANAPFRPAIEALKERPARRQVDRRFVFIDPDPGYALRFLRRAARAMPGFFADASSARFPNCRASSRSATISTRSRRARTGSSACCAIVDRDPRRGGGPRSRRCSATPCSSIIRRPSGSPPGAAARRSPPPPRPATATPPMACSRSRARSIASRTCSTRSATGTAPERLREHPRARSGAAVQARGARPIRRDALQRRRARGRSTSCAPTISASASAACACSRAALDRDRPADHACRAAADARGHLRHRSPPISDAQALPTPSPICASSRALMTDDAGPHPRRCSPSGCD